MANSGSYHFGRGLLHWWAILTALATYILLWSGGLVTSINAGMSVPDWPSSFGYNMFLFPVSKWVDGIFYEHSHRLIASGVGLMTVFLVVAAFILEPRRWVKIFAAILLGGVILQGIFGGLRVVLNKDHIGILHALLAQSFFSAMLVFCVVTSQPFVLGRWADYDPSPGLKRLALFITGMIFLQLALGATMRHEHIGLAVPDFPLAYGQVLPDTSTGAMQQINAERAVHGDMPLQPSFIWVHMAHRAMAVLICAAIFLFFLKSRSAPNRVRVLGLAWLMMVIAQFALGAWSVLSNKAADVATLHMALGALMMGLGVILTFRLIMNNRTSDFALPDVGKGAEATA